MEGTRSKYYQLIEDRDLYEAQLSRELLGSTTLTALMISGFEKERWLRHVKCCLLLCNLEAMTRYNEPAPKKIKLDTPSTSNFQSSSSSSDADPKDYRYSCIEAEPNQRNAQQRIADKGGIPDPPVTFDIFDHLNKLFIEVKVSENAENRFNDFNEKMGLDTPKYGLCVIHPRTGIATYYNMSSLPGESKVIQFILLRAAKMTDLGLNINAIDIQQNLSEEVMVSSFLNGLKSEFMEDILSNVNKTPKIEDVTFNFSSMKPVNILKMLEKPLEIEGPPITWSGKLLPSCWLKPIEVEGKEDKYMITQVINEMNKDMSGHWLDEVIKSWDYEKSSNFELYKERKMRHVSEKLKEMLGIGSKEITRNDHDDSTRQPDYGGPVKMKYHRWFENLLLDLSRETDYPADIEHLKADESQANTTTDRIAICTFNSLLSMYSRTHIANHVQYNINFYSRLAGSYAPKNSESTGQSNVVIMPLYFKIKRDHAPVRLVSGFCIRAPQHARNPHDKINIVLVERVKKDARTREYLKYARKPEILEGEDCLWVVRQQAIEKADPQYLVFLENALFVPTNFVGELILARNMYDETHLEQAMHDVLGKYNGWLVERIVESVVIALTSRAADEGAFAMLRKFFMIMLSFKRGKSAGCLDVKGFCDKMNECLVNNEMGLYYVQVIRQTLEDIIIPNFG